MNAAADQTGTTGSVGDDVLRTVDFLIAIDTSGSTNKGSLRLRGKSRLFEMREECERVASEAARFDSDGLTLLQFSSEVQVYDGVTPDKIDTVFREIHSGGTTDTAGAVRAITGFAQKSTKPVVAFVFTDGEADDENDVVRALAEAGAATKGRPKLGIVFIQVGDDPSAKAFLDRLDSGLGSQGIPDMVATVPASRSEGLTLGNLVWLAQNA